MSYTINEIIEDYYIIRLHYYSLRKQSIVDIINKRIIKLSNQVRYILENLDGTIDLRHKNQQQINDMLSNKQYTIIDDDVNYHYLVKMPMISVSIELVNKIRQELQNIEHELEIIQSTSIEQMWLNDLDNLSNAILEFNNNAILENNNTDNEINPENNNNTSQLGLSNKHKRNKIVGGGGKTTKHKPSKITN